MILTGEPPDGLVPTIRGLSNCDEQTDVGDVEFTDSTQADYITLRSK